MTGEEQMQTITVDGEAQAAWLSEVRRFHSEVKLLAVNTAGRQHTFVDIGPHMASWHSFEGPASQIELFLSFRETSWSCHLGPTTSLHIRVDRRGQPEVWSGSMVVAKLFTVEAAPDDWHSGLFHVRASYVRDLAVMLACDRTMTLRSLDLSYCEKLSDLGPLASLTQLTSLNLWSCDELSDLGPLASLTQLTSLNLSRCEKLNDLGPLASLTQLTSLNLSSCDELRTC